MSLTVRYPTGLAVTYNDAHYSETDETGTRLYDKKDEPRTIIVRIQASAGAAIEYRRACRAEFSAMTVEKAARYLAGHPDELAEMPVYIARDLKRALVAFNAKTGELVMSQSALMSKMKWWVLNDEQLEEALKNYTARCGVAEVPPAAFAWQVRDFLDSPEARALGIPGHPPQ